MVEPRTPSTPGNSPADSLSPVDPSSDHDQTWPQMPVIGYYLPLPVSDSPERRPRFAGVDTSRTPGYPNVHASYALLPDIDIMSPMPHLHPLFAEGPVEVDLFNNYVLELEGLDDDGMPPQPFSGTSSEDSNPSSGDLEPHLPPSGNPQVEGALLTPMPTAEPPVLLSISNLTIDDATAVNDYPPYEAHEYSQEIQHYSDMNTMDPNPKEDNWTSMCSVLDGAADGGF